MSKTASGFDRLLGDEKSAGVTDSQYVTFALGNQAYGLNVGDAIEVIRLVAMSEPPEAPPYVMGLINIRGRVVPIVDMRLRLGMEPADYSLATPILVVAVNAWTVGLIVDKVSEVVTLPAGMIEPPTGAFSQSRVVSGVAKIDAKLIFLLDLPGLFSTDDTHLFEKLFAANQVPDKALV